MKEYPTDEELELFIEKLERQELYAPKHMKEQILDRAFPKQTASAMPKSGGGRDPVQLFSYRLKIIAGMAAALMMLVLLPIQGELQEAQRAKWEDSFRTENFPDEGQDDSDREKGNWNCILNDGMRRAGAKLNAWIGRAERVNMESFFEK